MGGSGNNSEFGGEGDDNQKIEFRIVGRVGVVKVSTGPPPLFKWNSPNI